jgi:hypothetical protein
MPRSWASRDTGRKAASTGLLSFLVEARRERAQRIQDEHGWLVIVHEPADQANVCGEAEPDRLDVHQRPGLHADAMHPAVNLAFAVLGVDVQDPARLAVEARDGRTMPDRGRERQREQALPGALPAGQHRHAALRDERLDDPRNGRRLGAEHLVDVGHTQLGRRRNDRRARVLAVAARRLVEVTRVRPGLPVRPSSTLVAQRLRGVVVASLDLAPQRRRRSKAISCSKSRL